MISDVLPNYTTSFDYLYRSHAEAIIYPYSKTIYLIEYHT